jgi:ribosomal-protein-alanine N-acetyltransferase
MTPALHIRIARAQDARGIARMSRDLIEYGLPWTWQPARVAGAIAAEHTNVIVVREDRDLVGFGIMEYLDEDAHLVLFAVRPASQRQRVGTQILAWLEAAAIVAGAKRVRLEARRENAAARHFYNEHGYHEITIKSRMYSGAIDGIRLEKWLRPAATSDA